MASSAIHTSIPNLGVASLKSFANARTQSRYPLRIRAKVEPSDKSVEIMRKFSEQYARRSDTYFCVDKAVTSVVIKGLAEHKDTLGAPLCPCRHYDDKVVESEQGFWNCPCVPMRERLHTFQGEVPSVLPFGITKTHWWTIREHLGPMQDHFILLDCRWPSDDLPVCSANFQHFHYP